MGRAGRLLGYDVSPPPPPEHTHTVARGPLVERGGGYPASLDWRSCPPGGASHVLCPRASLANGSVASQPQICTYTRIRIHFVYAYTYSL